ncbi:hypothetical protein KC326_g31 [Hortaea werneckii]|nr:hypothetical protein KC326_g31 [Hortaea werneckii]
MSRRIPPRCVSGLGRRHIDEIFRECVNTDRTDQCDLWCCPCRDLGVPFLPCVRLRRKIAMYDGIKPELTPYVSPGGLAVKAIGRAIMGRSATGASTWAVTEDTDDVFVRARADGLEGK